MDSLEQGGCHWQLAPGEPSSRQLLHQSVCPGCCQQRIPHGRSEERHNLSKYRMANLRTLLASSDLVTLTESHLDHAGYLAVTCHGLQLLLGKKRTHCTKTGLCNLSTPGTGWQKESLHKVTNRCHQRHVLQGSLPCSILQNRVHVHQLSCRFLSNTASEGLLHGSVAGACDQCVRRLNGHLTVMAHKAVPP